MTLQFLLNNATANELLRSKPNCHGWLKKRNQKGKMQKRYCVITKGYFFYFEDDNSKRARGGFSLYGYRASEERHAKYDWAFELECAQFSYQRRYFFAASSVTELTKWISMTNHEAEKLDNKKGYQLGQPESGPDEKSTIYFVTEPDESLHDNKHDPLESGSDDKSNMDMVTEPVEINHNNNQDSYIDLLYANPLLPKVFEMSRESVERLLIGEEEGVYLIRLGSTKQQVLSVHAETKVRHYILYIDNDLIFLEHEMKFVGIYDLLRYYHTNCLPNCYQRLSYPYVEEHQTR